MSAWHIGAEVEGGAAATQGADVIAIAGLVGCKCGAVQLGLDLVVALNGNHGAIGQELLQVPIPPIPAVGCIWRVAARQRMVSEMP